MQLSRLGRHLGAITCAACLSIPWANAHAVPVHAIDDSGNEIRLAQPAQRIISLAPHATELLADVDALSQVVAVSAFSDYPPEANSLPRIGGDRGFDLEAIAALKPDLVIAWTSGNNAGQIAALERLGITVFRSDPSTLEQIASSLERLGELTGHGATGQAAAAAFRLRVAGLTARYSGRASRRIFYEVWDDPLMTINGRHIISSVLRLCAGVNVFDGLGPLTPTVSQEAVLAADPEFIVMAGESGHEKEQQERWRRWRQLSAVRKNQFIVLPAALITRATPRVLDGAEILCTALDASRN